MLALGVVDTTIGALALETGTIVCCVSFFMIDCVQHFRISTDDDDDADVDDGG